MSSEAALFTNGPNMANPTARYVPPQDDDQLLLAWVRRAREAQFAHYEMAEDLSQKARALGLPVIVLSALVGTSALASVAAEVIPAFAKIAIGLLSIAAAVLSSLQTFLGYAARAEKHRTAGAQYGVVRRKLEQEYAGRARGFAPDRLDALRDELDGLGLEAPNVPDAVFQKIQKRELFVEGTPEHNAKGN